MDPIQIINKAVFDIDQELKKDSNPHKENLYMHYLSIMANRMMENTIDARIHKLQTVLKNIPNPYIGINGYELLLDNYKFVLSLDFKKLNIFTLEGNVILECNLKTTLHQKNLIKIAMDNGKYSKKEEIDVANELIYNRIECIKVVENFKEISQAFDKLDDVFFTTNNNGK